jgi:lipoprotein NlpI
MWVLRARLGHADEATKNLTSYLEHRQGPDPWVANIAKFLIGSLPETEFIASASAKEPFKDQEHHCEAWYYAGMTRLLTGDKTTASDYFNRCLATKRTRFTEYVLAHAD